MNFEFSADQKLLGDQARKFLADNCASTEVRKILEGSDAYHHDLWRGIAELGWLGTAIPEAYGGLGAGYLELCVLAEELGRALAPVPFSSSIYLAAEALLLAGTEDQKQRWLPRLASGEAIGTFAIAESSGGASLKSVHASVSDGRLTGLKLPVPNGDSAISRWWQHCPETSNLPPCTWSGWMLPASHAVLLMQLTQPVVRPRLSLMAPLLNR